MLNNENYSWENYFKHPFFYEERQRKLYYENNFNYLCEKHSIKLNSYCYKCKLKKDKGNYIMKIILIIYVKNIQ